MTEQETKAEQTSVLMEEFLAVLDISRDTIVKLGARHDNMVSNKELLTLIGLMLIESSIASDTPMEILLILLRARIPAIERVVSLAREQAAEATP